MPAGTHNLFIEQGATFFETIELVNEDDGTPFDLTGFTGRAQMRKTLADDDGIDFVVEILEPETAGALTLELTVTQVSGINYTHGVWDLFLDDSDPDAEVPVIKALKGVTELEYSATRAAS